MESPWLSFSSLPHLPHFFFFSFLLTSPFYPLLLELLSAPPPWLSFGRILPSSRQMLAPPAATRHHLRPPSSLTRPCSPAASTTVVDLALLPPAGALLLCARVPVRPLAQATSSLPRPAPQLGVVRARTHAARRPCAAWPGSVPGLGPLPTTGASPLASQLGCAQPPAPWFAPSCSLLPAALWFPLVWPHLLAPQPAPLRHADLSWCRHLQPVLAPSPVCSPTPMPLPPTSATASPWHRRRCATAWPAARLSRLGRIT